MPKLPRKPKPKKLPKRPRQSASLKVWENWRAKVKQIEKQNADALKDWKARVTRIKNDEKKKI